MSGKVYDNLLARLEDPCIGDAELFIALDDLRLMTLWQQRQLSRMVNRVRETTAYELYRVEGMERRGYLLQLPPTDRSKTKHVESIEVERRDANEMEGQEV